MTCSEARRLLIEVDPSLFVPGAAGADRQPSDVPALREHISDCRQCRRALERVRSRDALLARVLEQAGPRRPLREAVAEATTEARARQVLRRRRLRAGAVSGIAAALTLLITLQLMLPQGGTPPTALSTEDRLTRNDHPSRLVPAVEAGRGENIVVFYTDDPTIVVFWVY